MSLNHIAVSLSILYDLIISIAVLLSFDKLVVDLLVSYDSSVLVPYTHPPLPNCYTGLKLILRVSKSQFSKSIGILFPFMALYSVFSVVIT